MRRFNNRRSLKEKRKYLDEKHPHRHFRYSPKNLSVFGQDGKSITIGCSRNNSDIIEYASEPASFNVSGSLYRKIPHTIQNRQETDYSTISSKVDYISLTPFTRPKTSIHLRTETINHASDTPGPSYFPTSATPRSSPKIGLKLNYKFCDETIPGPGQYSPSVSLTRPKSAAYTIAKSTEDVPWADLSNTLGPGEYNISQYLSKPKRWAQKLQIKPKHPNKRLSLQDEIRLKYQ